MNTFWGKIVMLILLLQLAGSCRLPCSKGLQQTSKHIGKGADKQTENLSGNEVKPFEYFRIAVLR